MSEMEMQYSPSEMPMKQGSTDQFLMELERLTELIDRMEGTLAYALRPATPSAVGADKYENSSKIRDNVYRLGDLNTRLEALIQRVDL